MPTQEDRMQALVMWILAAIPGIGIVSPLVFMFRSKNREFVYRNTMQCLAFMILVYIVWVIVIILAVATCGIGAILSVVPTLLQIIGGIVGGITANKGAVYEPPISSNLARAWFRV